MLCVQHCPRGQGFLAGFHTKLSQKSFLCQELFDAGNNILLLCACVWMWCVQSFYHHHGSLSLCLDNLKFGRFALGVFCRTLQPSCKATFVAQLVACSVNSSTWWQGLELGRLWVTGSAGSYCHIVGRWCFTCIYCAAKTTSWAGKKIHLVCLDFGRGGVCVLLSLGICSASPLAMLTCEADSLLVLKPQRAEIPLDSSDTLLWTDMK